MPTPMTPRRRSARLSATPEPAPLPVAPRSARSAGKGKGRANGHSAGKSLQGIEEIVLSDGEESEPELLPSDTRQNGRAHTTALQEDVLPEGAVATTVTHIPPDAALPQALDQSQQAAVELEPETLALARPRLRRRRRLLSKLPTALLARVLPPLLLLLGYLLPLALPIPPSGPWFDMNENNGISKPTYIDENALQPGQTHVYFDYKDDVRLADDVADALVSAELGALPGGERHPPAAKARLGARSDAQLALLARHLTELGLSPFVQEYDFSLNSSAPQGSPTATTGRNLFARFSAPRTDAREAFVLAAPWYSSWDGRNPADPDGGASNATRRVNVRGVALLVALARYLVTQPYLSRDVLFVLSDGHLAGMHAFLASYYNTQQANLRSSVRRWESPAGASDDYARGSVLWNALALDYPSDSFSRLELLHEGLNGQLPNQDVLNAVVRVAEQVDGVPVALPRLRADSLPARILQLGRIAAARLRPALEPFAVPWALGAEDEYGDAADRLWQQLSTLALGRTSGVHGLFTRYHVDAVTIRAVPAAGPFGFYHLGRIAEGTVRTYNNLLERLHHSQFFYLLTTPYRFVPFGVYIPASLLLSVGLTFYALRAWARLGAAAQQRRVDVFERHRVAITGAAQANPFRRLDTPLARPTHQHLLRELCHLAERSGAGLSARDFDAVQHELRQQGRPIGVALTLVAACHAVAALSLGVVARAPLGAFSQGSLACKPLRTALLLNGGLVVGAARLAARHAAAPSRHHLGPVLHTFAMLHAGALVAVVSVLNFAQAHATGFALALPLALAARAARLRRRSVAAALLALACAAPACGSAAATLDALFWDWHVLASSTVPYLFLACWPILLEALAALVVDL